MDDLVNSMGLVDPVDLVDLWTRRPRGPVEPRDLFGPVDLVDPVDLLDL